MRPTPTPSRTQTLVSRVKKVVGQRRQDEAGLAAELGGHAAAHRERKLVGRDAGDQALGQLDGRQRVEPLVQPRPEVRPVRTAASVPSRTGCAGVLEREGLGQQLLQLEHPHAARAQRVGERVVLGARPRRPRHVVEEQRMHVRRRDPLELAARAVQEHGAQRATSEPTQGASVDACPGARSGTALTRLPSRG
jgi:hypothetical protein